MNYTYSIQEHEDPGYFWVTRLVKLNDDGDWKIDTTVPSMKIESHRWVSDIPYLFEGFDDEKQDD